MKRTLTTLAILGLGAILAGCGEKIAEETAAPATAAAPTAPAGGMAGMPMAPAARMGSGTGSVTAIDLAAGTVTLDHAAMPEIGWPAMKMGFKAAPAALQGVKVGDRVGFDVKVENGKSEVTAIRKQG